MPNEDENNLNDAEPLNSTEETAAAERTVEQDIAEMTQRIAELDAKLLRAAADYQNMVRRSHQNVSQARDQQVGDMAKDLLPVLDHFDIALGVDPAKTNTQTLLEGLVMVRDELMRSLGKYGVERITAKPGEEFDPTRHEAMMRQKAEGIKTNHVVMQLQPGYMLRDRTLRPAKVSVGE